MTGAEGHGKKAEPTREWMIRTFGSVEAGRSHLQQVVSRSITGVGPRPRLQYVVGGVRRIAVGRRGESSDSLRLDLVRTYGLVWTAELRQSDDALAEYVVHGGNYRSYARKLGIRDEVFLTKAVDPAEVEEATIMSDRQLERVWRLHPEYEAPDEDALIGDPGEWATGEVGEVVIGDPGGEVERLPPLPMAIPKADGRGKLSLYFGHELDYGGGNRWNIRAFDTPLRVALGGELNRALGFGNSVRVDEIIAYAGDGYHWDRNNPLAPREVLSGDIGPVCRRLQHPTPTGRWFAWLGTAFNVPDTAKWETWQRRRAIYDRERNKSESGSKTPTGAIPLMRADALAA